VGGEEEEDLDDELSVHSFDPNTRSKRHKHEYLSTNLVTSHQLTLADVIAEEVTPQEMHERFAALAGRCRSHPNPFGVVDPKREVKAK